MLEDRHVVVQVLALEGVGDDGLVLHADQVVEARPAQGADGALQLPGRGVGAGKGKCQEMLSLRMVVAPGSSACRMPASSASRGDVVEDRFGRDLEHGDTASGP